MANWNMNYNINTNAPSDKKLKARANVNDNGLHVVMGGGIPAGPDMSAAYQAAAEEINALDGLDAMDPNTHKKAFEVVRDFCDRMLGAFEAAEE